MFIRADVISMVSVPPEQEQPERRPAIGLWRDRPEDGVALQQGLREEWASFEAAAERVLSKNAELYRRLA
jgi:hypothetical protein